MIGLATTLSVSGAAAEAAAQPPFSLHVGLAVMIVTGVIVWAIGQKLIRPMLVLTGAALGAGLGFIGGAFLPYEVSLWWPVIAGACVMGLFAFGLYRIFMAGTLAATLALVAPLGFFAYAEIFDHYPAEEPSPELTADELELPLPMRDELQRRIDQLDRIAEETANPEAVNGGDGERLDDDDDDNALDAELDDEASKGAGDGATPRMLLPEMDEETRARVTETVEHWRARLRSAIEGIAETAATQWNDFPTRQKFATLITGGAGAAVGFIAGMIAPNLGAMLVTSLVGAAVFLMSAFALVRAVGWSVEAVEPGSAAGALVMWLCVGLIGTVFQYRLNRQTPEKNGRDAEE